VEVARSLQNRDGFSLVHGVSLWERYNREALDGLRGMDVFVLGYESLMKDRRSVIGSLAEWLGSLDQFAGDAGHWDVDRGASLVSEEFRHQSIDLASDGLLLSEHRSLTKLLSGVDGGHRQFDPGPLPDESEWTKDVLADRREARLALQRESHCWELVAERVHRANVVEAEIARVTGVLDSTQYSLASTQQGLDSTLQRLDSTQVELEEITRIVTNMRASTSWRVTKPLRSLSARAPGRPRRHRGTTT
jgi:hypothetical protein